VPDLSELAVEIEGKVVEHVPYAKFQIMPFKPKGRRDAESIAINKGDKHLGRKTESYNLEIAAKRDDTLLRKVMRIIELHQPIRKAYVNYLGDVVQGENIYQGSKVGGVDIGAMSQIFDYAIPQESRFLTSLLQVVPEIEVNGVRGNHGRYDKTAPDKTNWDIFFLRSLQNALSNQPKISINCSDKFYAIVEIEGWRNFIFHGDQVRASQGVPLFALKRRCQEWYAAFGPIYMFVCGHWHCLSEDQVNQEAMLLINPAVVTGDEWALERVGRSSPPIQVVYGMHPKQGRTWTYPLIVDDAYLPEKAVGN